eukprot:CAMPEP_0198525482 /NCGR_PEP_ID=MMETSP1462-20131121/23381_1 /TAXON_ID=1333877 /ORGANISM="Brandtodinium nutriculum, Strain RCC3387" /LENGTH=394 /DNA_ID=CAMNT_0044255235 /DNA_START=2 /DNA_END=1183 /DNA_ORIENTATION=+
MTRLGGSVAHRLMCLADTQEDETHSLVEVDALATGMPKPRPAPPLTRWVLRIGVTLTVVGVALAAAFAERPKRVHVDQNRAKGLLRVHFDTGALHWGLARDAKCLDVSNNRHEPGTRLQVWQCAPNTDAQRFILPRKVGLIRSGGDPKLCVKAGPVGKISLVRRIVLWACNESDTMQQWVLPDGPGGAIRLKANRSRCLSEGSPQIDDRYATHGASSATGIDSTATTAMPYPRNGVDAYLGHCPAEEGAASAGEQVWLTRLLPSHGRLQLHTPEGALCLRAAAPAPGSHVIADWCQGDGFSHFAFPGRFGLIRWTLHQDLCVDAAGGAHSSGGHVQLQKCDDTSETMLWEVPSGPGPVRLRRHPSVCLAGADAARSLRTEACGEEEEEEQQQQQ